MSGVRWLVAGLKGELIGKCEGDEAEEDAAWGRGRDCVLYTYSKVVSWNIPLRHRKQEKDPPCKETHTSQLEPRSNFLAPPTLHQHTPRPATPVNIRRGKEASGEGAIRLSFVVEKQTLCNEGRD